MIFKILPICLIALTSCNFKSVPILNTQETKHNVHRASGGSQRLFGAYNWNDEFDFTSFDSDVNFSIDFEPNFYDDVRFMVPLWCYDYYQYCRKIDFDYYVGNEECEITVWFYTQDDFRSSYKFYVTQGDTIDDIVLDNWDTQYSYKNLIFHVRDAYYLESQYVDLFNEIFISQDNAYTISYTGYYNFRNGLNSIGSQVGTFGYMNFDNRIFFGFTNDLYLEVDSNKLYFAYYNNEVNEYNLDTYNLPFNNDVTLSKNILMSGVKMPLSSYTRLSQVGVFTYVRDNTYDDTDFEGLLFTIADTPVYFLSQFLSFELFGMNLFIALSGLITVLVVIYIVKKIKGI